MIKSHKIFLTHLATNALNHKPPLGLFRRFVLESHGTENKALNIKKRGIMPCTDIARVFALDAGIDVINTRNRLKAAYEEKIISHEAYRDLTEAFEYLSLIRLKHQAQKIKNQATVNNLIEPADLSSLEKRHLKDAFELISTYQKILSHQYIQGMI